MANTGGFSKPSTMPGTTPPSTAARIGSVTSWRRFSAPDSPRFPMSGPTVTAIRWSILSGIPPMKRRLQSGPDSPITNFAPSLTAIRSRWQQSMTSGLRKPPSMLRNTDSPPTTTPGGLNPMTSAAICRRKPIRTSSLT
ncbi:hypothetical protein SDC9_99721 [bioreactor metagenome]|uniref:Uncharacterized protein n=1 Tax=bioreactor metagenome TaxID=1076179 RepID=A0A645AIV7_9ZZZZ